MTDLLPIVLVPGLGSSPRSHLPILPALWRHGSVTIANQTRDETMASIAARLLREAPARFALLGHSLGGYIALEIMRQAPERVARLALLNTQARTDPPEVTNKRKSRIALAESGRYGDVIDESLPLLVHASRVGDSVLEEENRRAFEEAGAEAYVRQQKAIMGRIDQRPNLPRIRVPTLVLSGDDDRLIPNAFSREMAELIPGAKLEIVAQCGHMASIEQPEAVIEAIEDWFAA